MRRDQKGETLENGTPPDLDMGGEIEAPHVLVGIRNDVAVRVHHLEAESVAVEHDFILSILAFGEPLRVDRGADVNALFGFLAEISPEPSTILDSEEISLAFPR